MIDDLPRSAWYSRYASMRLRWRGPMSGPAFLEFLVNLASQRRLEGWVLLPMQDEVVELVSRHTDRLAAHYRLVTPPWEVLRWAHDKRLAYHVAQEMGIPYPKTWYPAGEEDLRALPVTFPAIVKPTISIRLQHAIGRKALPARDPSDLLAQYRRAAAIMGQQGILIQEVIPGRGNSQYSVAAFCKDGEIVAAMTARRTRQYPVDYGLSSSFVEAIEVPGLLETARALLRRLRLSGLVEVEFKHDARDGLQKLLDINVRPWGWHTLCIACGLDFSYIQYRDALGLPPQAATPSYGHRWRRMITDFPAGLHEIRRGDTTPAAFVRSLRGAAVASVFDLRDPLPALADLAIAVSRSMKTGSKGRSAIAPVEEVSPLMHEA